MDLLSVTFDCINVLAWPMLALGYPLFVTIRAIESGCVCDKRKVATYWIIFFFVKFLEWVPVWSYLRLIFICWLVVPHLNGALYLYQNLVHPYWQFELPYAITQFSATCSEWCKKLKKETFLALVESCLDENGSGTLEKLIASKALSSLFMNLSYRLLDRIVNMAYTRTEYNEDGQVLGEIQVMECTAKSNADESNQLGSTVENLLRTENKTSIATQVIISKPVIPAVAKLPDTSSALLVFQTRWTCEICKVTVSSELTLQSHLRGKKHKAEAKLWCAFCNLRVSGEIDMIAHLKGKRHLAKLQETFANSGSS